MYTQDLSEVVRSVRTAYERSQARYARRVAALKEKLASAEERASLGWYSGARHTRQVTELQRTASGLEKDLKKTCSKFESVVEFNDQLKQNLATAREDLAALRRDLTIARERIEFLMLRAEVHAEDQLVIDELREEVASLAFAVAERDERIRRLENLPEQASVTVSEKIDNSGLSQNLGTRPLVRTASI